MQLKCYVSGKTDAVEFYSFGAQISLPLTQEVFAKFILRAGEDEVHQDIMSRSQVLDKELRAKQLRAQDAVRDFCSGVELEDGADVADLQIAFRELDFKLVGLMLDKAKSGLRILGEIKKEYEE